MIYIRKATSCTMSQDNKARATAISQPVKIVFHLVSRSSSQAYNIICHAPIVITSRAIVPIPIIRRVMILSSTLSTVLSALLDMRSHHPGVKSHTSS